MTRRASREWVLYGPDDDVSPDQILDGPEIGRAREVVVIDKAAFNEAIEHLIEIHKSAHGETARCGDCTVQDFLDRIKPPAPARRKR